MAALRQNPLVNRMLRAALLDPLVFEQVEADKSALGQAMTVVVLSSLALGIGIGISALMSGSQQNIVGILFAGIGIALISWFVWALLTYLIGTTILKGPNTSADLGALLRTIGFSTSPGVLRIFFFIPGLGQILLIAVGIWMFAAMVVAVRQALDFSTGRAIATTMIGFVTQLGVLILLFALFGAPPEAA